MCENNSNNSDKRFYIFSSRFICAIYFDVRKHPSLHDEKETDILIRENKITLLVITLVVIFLICHTPNAVYSLYKSWQRHRESSDDEKKIKNFVLGKFPVTVTQKTTGEKREGKVSFADCDLGALRCSLLTVKAMKILINNERRQTFKDSTCSCRNLCCLLDFPGIGMGLTVTKPKIL